MSRTLAAATLVAGASAFAPLVSHVAAPVAASVDAAVAAVPAEVFSATSNILVAANENDFGGYFFPTAGLALLGAIIVFLAPPLADE